MKKILSLIVALVFVCATTISAQSATTGLRKNEAKTELKKDAKEKRQTITKSKSSYDFCS